MQVQSLEACGVCSIRFFWSSFIGSFSRNFWEFEFRLVVLRYLFCHTCSRAFCRVVFATFFNYLFGIVAFLIGLFVWKGNIDFIHIVSFFSILGLQLIFTSGLALALASLTVYVRDLTQIIGLTIQILFYTTTILYPITVVPERYRSYIFFNPLTLFIEAYHDLLLYERMPGLGNLCILLVISTGSLWAGFILFRKLQPGFSDVL